MYIIYHMPNFTRQQAMELLEKHIQNPNLRKHAYAVEAVMERFAPRFEGNVASWALTGLLHDLDWEQTQKTPQEHTLVAEKILTELGLEPELVRAIKIHNFSHGLKPETALEKVLYYVEELTGLITACALVNPQKLGGVSVESVLKKLKEKSFARGVNRDIINQAPSALNIPLNEIVIEVLAAMMAKREVLGL